MKVFISGISGTGKTTIGKRLVEVLNKNNEREGGWIFKDQDDFFLPEKPRTAPIFGGGRTKSNWDCIEAIDWVALNKYLDGRQSDNIIFVGYALRSDLITTKPDVHIHLTYATVIAKTIWYVSCTTLDCRELENLCIKSRLHTKKFKTDQDRLDDETMVRKVVVPFYFETLKHSKIDHTIEVLDREGKRVPVNWIIEKILILL
jgi:hypothetical protein